MNEVEAMDRGDMTGTAAGEPSLLTVEEVSQRLRLPRTAVYRLIMSGKLISLKVGRHRRVPNWAVADFILHTAEAQRPHSIH